MRNTRKANNEPGAGSRPQITTTMAISLNNQLKDWAGKYEAAEFIQGDPVQIPHRYNSRENIEISAFVTAWIAWGSRAQIIKKADFIDRVIFKGEPYHYVMGNNVASGNAPEWEQYKGSKESFYRTFTYGDFYDLCERLNKTYKLYPNLEAAIKGHAADATKAIQALQTLFGSVNGIPDGSTQSACKRLCLFLRWMHRNGSPVDFGLWTLCDDRNLIIPLDTHVHKQALRLGLTKRRTPDLRTAIEITDRFAEIFPDDPAKGDFALFGYGVNRGTIDTIKEVTEATKQFTEAQKGAATVMAETEKHLPRAEDDPAPEPTPEPEPIPEQPAEKSVDELTIMDVLKMPLFFNNVSAELKSIWQSRETARKDASKKGLRLKAHPIDRVHEAGFLEPGAFIVEYAKVLDRIKTGLPRAMRDVIETLGNMAFNKTMQKMVDDEKARNNSNGNN